VPAGADQDDLGAAAQFPAPVYLAKPEAVPRPLRYAYEQRRGLRKNPRSATGQAIDLIAAYRRTQEVQLLTEAITLFRKAAAALPVGHPDYTTAFSISAVRCNSCSQNRGST
jgi:hypothetical protein